MMRLLFAFVATLLVPANAPASDCTSCWRHLCYKGSTLYGGIVAEFQAFADGGERDAILIVEEISGNLPLEVGAEVRSAVIPGHARRGDRFLAMGRGRSADGLGFPHFYRISGNQFECGRSDLFPVEDGLEVAASSDSDCKRIAKERFGSQCDGGCAAAMGGQGLLGFVTVAAALAIRGRRRGIADP